MDLSEKWLCPECGREFKAAAHLRLHLKSHRVALERKNSAALAAKEQAEKSAIAVLMASASRDDFDEEETGGISRQLAIEAEGEEGGAEEEEEFDYERELARERESRGALARRMWEQSKGLPHKAMLPSASASIVGSSGKSTADFSDARNNVSTPDTIATASGTAEESSSKSSSALSTALTATSNDEKLTLREPTPLKTISKKRLSGEKSTFIDEENSMGSALVISVRPNITDDKLSYGTAGNIDDNHLKTSASVVTPHTQLKVNDMSESTSSVKNGKSAGRESEADEEANGLILFSNGSGLDTNVKESTGSVNGSGKGKGGKGRKGGKAAVGSSKGSLDSTGKGSKGGGKSGKGGIGSSMSSGSSKGGKGFSRPPPPPNKPAHLIPGNSGASTIGTTSNLGDNSSNGAVTPNASVPNSTDDQAITSRVRMPVPSTEVTTGTDVTSTTIPEAKSSASDSKPTNSLLGHPLQSSLSTASALDASNSRAVAQIPSGSSAVASDTARGNEAGKGKGKGKVTAANVSLDARRRLRLPPKNPSEIAPLASTSSTTPGKVDRSTTDNAALATRSKNGETYNSSAGLSSANRSPGSNIFGSVRSKPPPRPPPEITQAMRRAAWEAQFKRKSAVEKAAAMQQKKSKAAAARAAEKSTTREAQAAEYKEW